MRPAAALQIITVSRDPRDPRKIPKRPNRFVDRIRILKMPAYVATIILRNPPAQWTLFPNERETPEETQFSFELCSDFRSTAYGNRLLFPDSKLTSLDRLVPARSRVLTCPLHDNSPSGEEFIQRLKTSTQLRAFQERYDCDVIIEPDTIWRKNKRLIVFDMDSTLIQQEVIDEVAAFIGKKDEVSDDYYIQEITEAAMRGELDFESSLRARCALLEGVPADVFETLKTNGTITFTRGARNLCVALKRMGCKLAVLSGGFQPLADWVKEQLGLDYAFANRLEVTEDGQTLTGELVGPIVDAKRKAELLSALAETEGINMSQTIAIGDGANDLLMMKSAGLGIAFNAKPKVQAEAPACLNTGNLQDILYIMGVTLKEQHQLIYTRPEPRSDTKTA
ncbi:hypothetical protein TWF696_005346 [Orbilia brochopaga]|uniref:phosphoserine phosphatase n=1 Tax=Orbilia brochopaga TaxID=3140254 RepID=A0AAV9V2V0_9PEZI